MRATRMELVMVGTEYRWSCKQDLKKRFLDRARSRAWSCCWEGVTCWFVWCGLTEGWNWQSMSTGAREEAKAPVLTVYGETLQHRMVAKRSSGEGKNLLGPT